MHHFEYVSKKQAKPYKAELIEIINRVQDEVRDDFTFQFKFIGSSSRNMITFDPTTNIGFDFDVNLEVNVDYEDYEPDEIRKNLHDAFVRIARNYGYNSSENSTRVFTIKVVNIFRSSIIHSCDFAVVQKSKNGQRYIRFNRKKGNYTWEYQKKPYKELEKHADFLRKQGFWDEVLDKYLDKKNNNDDPYKHSRSLYAETINECFQRHPGC